MAFIREAKQAGGILELEQNTPILILGDLNLVGYAQQLETLLTGEIVNQQFAPSFSPDWDGSDFADLTARQSELPMFYTWYSVYSYFSPGRLDFMIYSDYVLSSENKFVLFTPEMNADTLSAYGLLPDDVTEASDHIPLVSDFKVLEPYSVGNNNSSESILLSNSPNPFWNSTTIAFNLVTNFHEFPLIKIYNIKGQVVKTLSLKHPSNPVVWDGTDENERKVSSGIYFYKLIVGKLHKTKKMILIR